MPGSGRLRKPIFIVLHHSFENYPREAQSLTLYPIMRCRTLGPPVLLVGGLVSVQDYKVGTDASAVTIPLTGVSQWTPDPEILETEISYCGRIE